MPYHVLQTFDPALIAPCGLNCATCIGYLRKKNACPGCRHLVETPSHYIRKCSLRNCVEMEDTPPRFCYTCAKFPCRRLKQLDKRYRAKYRTSAIENLHMIRESMEDFLAFESARRTCPHCGAVVCVHREVCLQCKASFLQ